MDGTVIVTDIEGQQRKIDITERLKIYRSEDYDERTVLDTGEELIVTDIHDWGVSREYDENGEPGYIELFEKNDQIYVRDRGTSNPTRLSDGHGSYELEPGTEYPIESKSTITFGREMVDSSKVQVEIDQTVDHREMRDETALWRHLQRETRHLEEFIDAEVGASRLGKTIKQIQDDIKALRTEEDISDVLEECHSELETVRGQLTAHEDSGKSPEKKPKKVAFRKASDVANTLQGVTERRGL